MKYLIIGLSISVLLAAPAQYQVYKTDNPPAIDGDLSDWDEMYFIDSIHSDTNVYARDDTLPWTREEFQMKVYMTWDDEWAYFAVKVISDDVIINKGQSRFFMDNVFFYPGGQAMGLCIGIDGSYLGATSSPYIPLINLEVGVKPNGNGEFPTYEFKILKSMFDYIDTNKLKMSIGSEENDDYNSNDMCFLAIGVEYTGPKQDWNSMSWGKLIYYPTYHFIDSIPEQNPQETHVFWYKASTNNYTITDCSDSGKGPCLPADALIHEGMIATGTVAQHSGSAWDQFIFGSGFDDQQGRCAFIWSRDLMNFKGKVDSAKIRAEHWDGWSGGAWLNEGPINIRCGVADFSVNIDTFGGPGMVPDTAFWVEWGNLMSSSMGYDKDTDSLMAEEQIYIVAPRGRPDEFAQSVLDSQFLEIDITDQVSWIINHTGNNKGNLSGQYAIMFLVAPNEGSTGKVNTYSKENCPGITGIDSDNPWTQDRNTAHIVVYGDLEPVSIEKRPEITPESPIIGSPFPNPFNPNTRIPYNLGLGKVGELKIFDIRGKMVFEKAVQGVGLVQWNAHGLGSGVYVLKVNIGNKQYVKRLILTK